MGCKTYFKTAHVTHEEDTILLNYIGKMVLQVGVFFIVLLVCGGSSYMGVCKKLRDLLDAILLFGNTLMIHKTTTCSHYVMLGLVNHEHDMTYDM